jgi:hypothetical protein
MGGQQAAGQWNQMANQPLNNLMQLFGNVISTPKHPVGANPLAGILGSALGGGGNPLASLFGGGGQSPSVSQPYSGPVVNPYNSNADNYNFIPPGQ